MKTTKRPTPTPLMLCTQGLLLLLAVLGSALAFFTTFSPAWNLQMLLPGLVLLSLIFLACFSLPRYGWLLLLFLGLLYAAGIWLLWETLASGSVCLYCSIVNFYAQHLPLLEEVYPLAQHTPEQWEAAATCFSLMAAAPLAALAAWAVVRLRSFWLTFCLTLPFVAAPLVALISPSWPPVLLLLICWSTLLLQSAAGRKDARGAGRLAALALPACAALLLALTAAFPKQAYTYPAWAAQAQTALINWLNRTADAFPFSGPGPFGSAFTVSGGAEEVDLSSAGPLSFTGRTVLRVESRVAGKMYLRGYSNARYEDNTWLQLPVEAYSESTASPRPDPSAPFSDQLGDFQPMNFPAMTAPDAPYYPVTVENVGAPGGCVYAPYQLLTTPEELAGARFQKDAYIARSELVDTHTVYYRPDALLNGAWSYVPLSQAAQAEYRYRSFVYNHYLELPQGFSEEIAPFLDKISALLQSGPFQQYITEKNAPLYPHYREMGLTQEAAASLQFADLVVYLLGQWAEYNPSTPVTPDGEEFTAYFLNESREGYCMHFASASTLLLRYLGVPARYTTGYVAYFARPGLLNVPDSAAHAWTEIYLDGYGWYPVDATPGYTGDQVPWVSTSDGAATQAPTAPALLTPRPSATPSARPSASPIPSSQPGRPVEDTFGSQIPAALWLFLFLLALVPCLVLRRRGAQALRRRHFQAADRNRAALAIYRYLLRMIPWGGTVPPQAEVLAQKARFSQHTLSQEELEELHAAAAGQARKLDAGLPPLRRLLFRYLWGLY